MTTDKRLEDVLDAFKKGYPTYWRDKNIQHAKNAIKSHILSVLPEERTTYIEDKDASYIGEELPYTNVGYNQCLAEIKKAIGEL